MISQSGRMTLLLLLSLFISLCGSVYFLQEERAKQLDSKSPEAGAVSNKVPLETSDSVLVNDGGFSRGMEIKVQFPEGTELEEFDAASLGGIKGVQGELAYKLYFNSNPEIKGVDKEYSGLTLFFISYPNAKKLPLKDFLPKITHDDKNQTNTLEEVNIGSFQGFKHTQCCYSGGVEEFYFLNEDLTKLILIKAYNYGPDHDFYNEKLNSIVKSIKFL